MKTAMIAALSGALLCGLLSTQTYAFECEKGQASVQLEYDGMAPNGHFESYLALVRGKATLDFDRVPDLQEVERMDLYIVSGSNTLALVPYLGKVQSFTQPCLKFDSGMIRGESMTFFIPGHGGPAPRLCYSGGGDFQLDLDMEVSSSERLDPDNPRIPSVRVYLEGRHKVDGKTFRLFDTRNPCKE